MSVPVEAIAGGVARDFTIRYQIDQPGAIRIVGNSTMTCSAASGSLIGYLRSDPDEPPRNFANPNCQNARNRQAGTTPTGAPANINDTHYMRYVDIDSDSTTVNSSSSEFSLPANAEITFAGLYWSGTTAVVTTERFYGQTTDYDVFIPAGQAAANASLRNQVKFRIDGGAYQTLTATQLDTDAQGTAAGTGDVYQGFIDVTALVDDQPGGSTRTYTVANVQSARGQKGYGSWALVVVYEDTSEPMRSLTVYDGFIREQNGDPPRETVIDGFITPTTAAVRAEAGVVVYEGDLGIVGDQFLINGSVVSDALNPANDFWNSNETEFGVEIPGRTPSNTNLFGVDINLMNVSSFIGNGDRSATFRFTTDGDQYYPGVATFLVDIFRPELTRSFTKQAVDVNGGEFLPGETIEYEISYTNTGNDGATDVVLRDAVPVGSTYVPGSIRVIADPEAANIGPKTDAVGDDEAEYDSVNNQVVIRTGTGADETQGGLVDIDDVVTVRFQTRIDPNFAAPDTLENQATIDYASEITGEPYTGGSDDPDTPEEGDATTITVSAPDAELVLVKRITAVNGSSISTVTNDPDDVDDDDPLWPSGYLQGAIALDDIQPGDELEYTVYFLSNGNIDLTEVNICDLIPTDTQYVSGSGAIAFDSDPAAPWDDARNADAGEYLSPNTTVTTADVPGVGLCRSDRDVTQDWPISENPNGAVWVEVDKALTPVPSGQVGYVRFRARVNSQ